MVTSVILLTVIGLAAASFIVLKVRRSFKKGDCGACCSSCSSCSSKCKERDRDVVL